MVSFRLRLIALAAALLPFVLVPQLPAAVATPGPGVAIHPIVGSVPVIDGSISAGEWPWSPQISIDSSYRAVEWPGILPAAPAFAIFAATGTDLYILVDVPGDTTDGPNGDECLFWFLNPGEAARSVPGPIRSDGSDEVEAWIYGSTSDSDHDGLGGSRAIGFGTSPRSATPHRIYEFQIPYRAIGALPGGEVPFCSPFIKYGPTGAAVGRSMGYDGSNGHDNIWPPGLILGDLTTWAAASFPASDIPATDPFALIGIALAIAFLGALALRRI